MKLAALAAAVRQFDVLPSFAAADPGPASDPPTQPAWLAALPVGVISPIPGTSLKALLGSATMDRAAIEAWCGLAWSATTAYSTLGGGHNDGSRNGAYALDFTQDAPKWVTLRASSTVAPRVQGDFRYYDDGSPVSRHSYNYGVYIKARNRVFHLLAGSCYSSGSAGLQVDAFDLATNTYDPAGKYEFPVRMVMPYSAAVAKHPVTEDCYVGWQLDWRRWDQATAKWFRFHRDPRAQVRTTGTGRGAAIDAKRNRIVLPGDASEIGNVSALRLIDLTTFAETTISLSGLADEPPMTVPTVVWVEKYDVYFVCCSTGRIFRIDPVTNVAVKIATMPPAQNGVWSRFGYVAAVDGLAYLPNYDSDMLFMPLGAAPQPEGHPTPPLSGRIPIIGNGHHSAQFDHATADWIDPTKLPAPIPWTVPTVAPSQQGVEIPRDKWKKLHVFGQTSQLYGRIPRILNGRFSLSLPAIGDNAMDAASSMESVTAPRPGPRGVGLSSPLATFHGHEMRRDDGTIAMRAPPFMGIRVDDVMVFEFLDGSIAESPKGTCKGPLDFSFTDDRFLFLKADTFGNRIVAVERKWAFPDPSNPGVGTEDMSKWRERVICSAPCPASVRCVKGGRTFIASYGKAKVNNVLSGSDGALLEIVDGVPKKIIDIPRAQFVDFEADDAGNMTALIVVTTNSQIYRIKPDAPSLDKQLMPAAYASSDTLNAIFLQVEVDRKGTIGQKNAAYIIRSHGSGNIDGWRVTGDTVKYVSEWLDAGFGRSNVGSTHSCGDAIGHYVWTVAVSPTIALLRTQGLSNASPSYFRPTLPSDPPEDACDNQLMQRGLYIVRTGSMKGFGAIPSFTAQLDECGWSLLGITADYIAQMSYAHAAAFVQRGMFGIFPRPDLTGYNLLAILYYLYRSSQRFLLEGKPLMDGLRAFIGPVSFDPADPHFPINPANDNFLEVHESGGKLRVEAWGQDWQRTTPPDPTLTARVYVDQGTVGEKDLGVFKVLQLFDKPKGLATTANGQHAWRAVPINPKTPHWPRTTII